MNMLVLAIAAKGGATQLGLFGDSCALLLFLSGAVSLAIAGYLLYKSPKAQSIRYYTRRR